MIRSIKLSALLFSLTALVYFTSCSEDEPIIDVGDDVIVSDGFYIIGGSAPSEIAAASGILTLGLVEDEGFATKTRANYYESYIYLDANAGGVQFAEYQDNEAVVYGGATETIDYGDDESNDTPMGAFLKGTLTADGAAVTPLKSGLHHVIVDKSSGIFLVVPVNSWGVIGPATAEGWGADTDIATISSDGLSYSGSEIVLRDGTMKFRYNDGWKIDMRTDPDAGYGETNGFVALTNFGGTTASLEHGGADFSAPEEGTYDISLTFTNGTVSPTLSIPEQVMLLSSLLIPTATLGGSSGLLQLPDGMQIQNCNTKEKMMLVSTNGLEHFTLQMENSNSALMIAGLMRLELGTRL